MTDSDYLTHEKWARENGYHILPSFCTLAMEDAAIDATGLDRKTVRQVWNVMTQAEIESRGQKDE